jgi:hypothetical protein
MCLDILQQEHIQHDQQSKPLQEELKRLKADRDDDAADDLNYDLSDKESQHENDISYVTE